MDTFGWVLILGALLLGRQVATGRARETPGDIKDLVVGAFRGDLTQIKSVTTQRGTNTVPAGDATASGVGSASPAGTALLAKMHELALFANNRYRYASTGPDAYDCSGLIYRALVDLGYYKGVRFASATWGIQGAPIASKVTTPAVGDIVVWPGKHMGVVSGNDLMYSALNPTDGILESKISHESDHAGFQPSYWRLKG